MIERAKLFLSRNCSKPLVLKKRILLFYATLRAEPSESVLRMKKVLPFLLYIIFHANWRSVQTFHFSLLDIQHLIILIFNSLFEYIICNLCI